MTYTIFCEGTFAKIKSMAWEDIGECENTSTGWDWANVENK
jgi:hypothetical protein